MIKWYPVLAEFVLEQLAVIEMPGLMYIQYSSATWFHLRGLGAFLVQNKLLQLFHCTNPGPKAGKSETSLLELLNQMG